MLWLSQQAISSEKLFCIGTSSGGAAHTDPFYKVTIRLSATLVKKKEALRVDHDMSNQDVIKEALRGYLFPQGVRFFQPSVPAALCVMVLDIITS